MKTSFQKHECRTWYLQYNLILWNGAYRCQSTMLTTYLPHFHLRKPTIISIYIHIYMHLKFNIELPQYPMLGGWSAWARTVGVVGSNPLSNILIIHRFHRNNMCINNLYFTHTVNLSKSTDQVTDFIWYI